MTLNNRYLVLRHGHSLANQAHLIISDPRRGSQDYGLSAAGRDQVARTLDHWPLALPDRIVCSPFLRTRETAALAAARFLVPMSEDAALRERFFGELDGGPDLRYPDVWQQDALSPDHHYAGVESLAQVAERGWRLIERLEQAHRGQTLLLVSHGDTLQILLTRALGLPLTRHRELKPLATAEVRELLVPARARQAG